MNPLTKSCQSNPITIFMAGNYNKACEVVQKYCDDVGFCVTVEKTVYIYTNGSEEGIKIGLINYPRFPSDSSTLFNKASEIADLLRIELEQESYSIQTPTTTTWYSYRKENIQ